MKGGQGESDMTKVADAVLKREVAGRTFSSLAGYAETRVEGTVRDRGSIVLEVVEGARRDLQDTLADNILDRPEEGRVSASYLGTHAGMKMECRTGYQISRP